MSEEKKKSGCNWVVVLIVALVSIPIIITVAAIVIAVSVPVYSEIQARAAQTKGLENARRIHFALVEHAIDHDGVFPGGVNDSNAAYRQLFGSGIVDESMFYIPGSAFHRSLPAGQTKPDGIIGEPPMFSQALERGENQWAYVSGLNQESKGNLPIIADGFSENPGIYSADPMKKGGVWEGKSAIVVRVDGSTEIKKLDQGDLRVYERRSGQNIDIFGPDYGTDPNQILNPK